MDLNNSLFLVRRRPLSALPHWRCCWSLRGAAKQAGWSAYCRLRLWRCWYIRLRISCVRERYRWRSTASTVNDAFSNFAKILIYIAAAISLMIAPRFLEKAGAMRAEYPVLILLACVGMGIMVSATDLITLYIGLELNSLAAYVLASFVRSDGRSAEAGLKYFVLGALASGILLFGMSLLYGFTGSTDFTAIGTAWMAKSASA